MLRHAREEKGLTLDEIAQATRINRKALEDIENDVPLKLPPTYARAFVKAFALQVDLDPVELLKLGEPAAPPSTNDPEPSRVDDASSLPHVGVQKSSQRQVRGVIVISTLTAVGLIAILVWLQREHDAETIQEIPFPEVVREQGAKLSPPLTRPAGDSSGTSSAAPQQTMIDSLVLEGVAVESTWVRVNIDSAAAKEYSVPPQLRMRWKAKQSFTLSVGNGGGMYFSLNGVRLGTFGQANTVVKDISLSHESLAKIQKLSKQGKKKEK